MIFTLSPWLLVVVNILGWLIFHLSIPYVVTLMPASRFDPKAGGYRIRRWERGGRWYEKLFAVRRWKGLLPDGAALFAKGFRKKHLKRASRDYLERFSRETCRGEMAHWLVMACAPLFFLWNPPWAGGVMIAYGIIANLPCILVQRYNRARLLKALG